MSITFTATGSSIFLRYKNTRMIVLALKDLTRVALANDIVETI